MDIAAHDLGIDPAEIRRKNFIPSDQFPYTIPSGQEYDSGDYEATLDKVLEIGSYQELRKEQEAAAKEGRRLGIGLGCRRRGDCDRAAGLVADPGCCCRGAGTIDQNGTALDDEVFPVDNLLGLQRNVARRYRIQLEPLQLVRVDPEAVATRQQEIE